MKNNKRALSVVIAVLVVAALIAYCLGPRIVEQHGYSIEEVQNESYDSYVGEVQELAQDSVATVNNRFDTSALDAWAYGGSNDGIRMVGATYYATANDGSVVVQDDYGVLWPITCNVDASAFLLLWIDNNNTDDYADDVVVKVWSEAH